jgi:hypothetical protein
MQHTSRIFHAALGLALGALCAASVLAQEILPKPEPPFGGKIGETYLEILVEERHDMPALRPMPSISAA